MAHKKKLKSKILEERIKTLEANLEDRNKECTARSKVNIRYAYKLIWLVCEAGILTSF